MSAPPPRRKATSFHYHLSRPSITATVGTVTSNHVFRPIVAPVTAAPGDKRLSWSLSASCHSSLQTFCSRVPFHIVLPPRNEASSCEGGGASGTFCSLVIVLPLSIGRFRSWQKQLHSDCAIFPRGRNPAKQRFLPHLRWPVSSRKRAPNLSYL